MLSIAMGCLSALSYGVADFIASQNARRINALRTLFGMLCVGSVLMTLVMFMTSGFVGLLSVGSLAALLLASLHGTAMAGALLCFFHAMTIGKISVVAPIVAAHPAGIVLFYLLQGSALSQLQFGAILLIMLGCILVGLSEGSKPNDDTLEKTYAKRSVVIGFSICASALYAAAIVLLQAATTSLPDMQVIWLGRMCGLLTVGIALAFSKQAYAPIRRRWGWVLIHGCLDVAGLTFLVLGSVGGTGNILAAVVASTFPVVTMALAALVLREKVGPKGLIGAGIVLAGTAALAGS